MGSKRKGQQKGRNKVAFQYKKQIPLVKVIGAIYFLKNTIGSKKVEDYMPLVSRQLNLSMKVVQYVWVRRNEYLKSFRRNLTANERNVVEKTWRSILVQGKRYRNGSLPDPAGAIGSKTSNDDDANTIYELQSWKRLKSEVKKSPYYKSLDRNHVDAALVALDQKVKSFVGRYDEKLKEFRATEKEDDAGFRKVSWREMITASQQVRIKLRRCDAVDSAVVSDRGEDVTGSPDPEEAEPARVPPKRKSRKVTAATSKRKRARLEDEPRSSQQLALQNLTRHGRKKKDERKRHGKLWKNVQDLCGHVTWSTCCSPTATPPGIEERTATTSHEISPPQVTNCSIIAPPPIEEPVAGTSRDITHLEVEVNTQEAPPPLSRTPSLVSVLSGIDDIQFIVANDPLVAPIFESFFTDVAPFADIIEGGLDRGRWMFFRNC